MNPDLPVHHEALVSNAYYGAFALICLWELLVSRRALAAPVGRRWLVNIALGGVNTVVEKALFPLFGVALAGTLAPRGIGLFNWVSAPAFVAIAGSVLAMDGASYAWHRLEHRVPLLWRFHMVHHCDIDVDLTTELRHHPMEAILSVIMSSSMVAVIGPPPVAVFTFALAQSVGGLWQHGNVRVPAALDRIVRGLFVTPDMHRIHHSAERSETDSNYTMLFSFWDRLFGTYRHAPRLGHEGMTLGLNYLRERADQRIDRILLQPFRRRFNPAA